MIRILLLAALSLWTSPAHGEWQCDGIITSSGSRIGSERNTAPPPVVYCAPDSGDPKCWRRQRS
jgi:hypothetical protein